MEPRSGGRSLRVLILAEEKKLGAPVFCKERCNCAYLGKRGFRVKGGEKKKQSLCAKKGVGHISV